MSSDARAALSQFVAALERHYEAAAQRRSELDPAVVSAYDDLAAAFVAYDDALFETFDEVTPFDLSEDDDDFDEEDDDLDDEDLEGELDEEDLDGEDDDEGLDLDDLDEDLGRPATPAGSGADPRLG